MAKRKTEEVVENKMETLDEKQKRLYENILKIEATDPSIKNRNLEKFLRETALEGETLKTKGYVIANTNKKRWLSVEFPKAGVLSAFDYFMLEASLLDSFGKIEDYVKSAESLDKAWYLLWQIQTALDFKGIYIIGKEETLKNKSELFAKIKKEVFEDFRS